MGLLFIFPTAEVLSKSLSTFGPALLESKNRTERVLR